MIGTASVAEKLKTLLEAYIIVDVDDEEVKRVYRKHGLWMYETEADYDIELNHEKFYTYEQGEKIQVEFE